jgi:hypothetical protein
MPPRVYYNRRVGKDGDPPRLTLAEASKEIAAGYSHLAGNGYLQRAFGYYCVDAGEVAGRLGTDMRTHLYLSTGIRIEGSVFDFLVNADEIGLFTLVEFLHDNLAKPDEHAGRYHSFSGCGWHYDCRADKFDEGAARQEWRDIVNRILRYYGDGYELSADGEVVRLAPDGLATLLEAEAPLESGDKNIAKLKAAVRTFRRGLSSREEQKQALYDLAGLLEFYRPQVKERLLSGDEADLFKIANNYAIRHHRADQKDDYGGAWLTWLFYLYLSTVHLLLSLVHGQREQPPTVKADDDIPF